MLLAVDKAVSLLCVSSSGTGHGWVVSGPLEYNHRAWPRGDAHRADGWMGRLEWGGCEMEGWVGGDAGHRVDQWMDEY